MARGRRRTTGAGNGHDPPPESQDEASPAPDAKDDLALVPMAARTLRGDLRDWLLDRIRHLPKPWHLMSEAEQRVLAITADSLCDDILRRAVEIVASEGRITIGATLGAVKIDKTIEAKLVVGRFSDQRNALFEAQGSRVVIVVADAERYLGERGAAKVDPQQPALPIETLQVDPDAPKPAEIRPGIDGARELGVQARKHGAHTEANPFPAGAPEFGAWLDGWLDGADPGERPTV